MKSFGKCLLATLTLLGVAACGVGGVDPTLSVGPTDESALSRWTAVLGPALDDLNHLQAPSMLAPESKASVDPCTMQDGDLFGISAGRTWKPSAGAAPANWADGPSPTVGKGFVQIVEELTHMGWKVLKRTNEVGMITRFNRGFDTVVLKRDIDPNHVFATVQLTPIGDVLADLDFKGSPRGCKGS